MFPTLEGNSRRMMTKWDLQKTVVYSIDSKQICLDPPVGGAGDATYNQNDSRRLSLVRFNFIH